QLMRGLDVGLDECVVVGAATPGMAVPQIERVVVTTPPPHHWPTPTHARRQAMPEVLIRRPAPQQPPKSPPCPRLPDLIDPSTINSPPQPTPATVHPSSPLPHHY